MGCGQATIKKTGKLAAVKKIQTEAGAYAGAAWAAAAAADRYSAGEDMQDILNEVQMLEQCDHVSPPCQALRGLRVAGADGGAFCSPTLWRTMAVSRRRM